MLQCTPVFFGRPSRMSRQEALVVLQDSNSRAAAELGSVARAEGSPGSADQQREAVPSPAVPSSAAV